MPSNITELLLNGASPGTRTRPTGLLSRLTEAAEAGNGITLTGLQVESLVRLLNERHQHDPFASGKSVLNQGDLELLGVTVDDGDDQIGIRDDGPAERKPWETNGNGQPDDTLLKKQPLFGPESAIVAPDCTPAGSDPIPDSVAAAMRVVINNGADDQEYVPGSHQAHQPAPAPIQSPAHQAPAHQPPAHQPPAHRLPPPQPAQESVAGDALATIRALRESTRSQHVRKTKRPVRELSPAEQAAKDKLMRNTGGS